MNELRLKNPPIVEAVLDIDCDLPVGFDVASVKDEAIKLFAPAYPGNQIEMIDEHQIESVPDQPFKVSSNQRLQAFRFIQADKKQLVQIRKEGFSFNRLAPYTSLDDYLLEIRRTWNLYRGLVKPVLIRGIRLRYINRFRLPLADGTLELDTYLKTGPKLPDEEGLTFSGFLNQHMVVEKETGNSAMIVLTAQPCEGGYLPIILDIATTHPGSGDAGDWDWISGEIQKLRALKNRIFYNTLTSECVQMFYT